MTPQEKAASLRNDLAQFYGSEEIYRYGINRNVLYTEGVQHFAEAAGAYWFLDILATEPAILRQAREFAAVTLTVDDGGALITVTDGNKKRVFSRSFAFTSCPPGDWKFFFENMTIMLPGER